MTNPVYFDSVHFQPYYPAHHKQSIAYEQGFIMIHDENMRICVYYYCNLSMVSKRKSRCKC